MACSITPLMDGNTHCLSFEACSPIEYDYQFSHAVSIKQPFASLVVFGLKPLEIRSKRTNIRGRVVICASQKPYIDGMFRPDRPGIYLPTALDYVKEMGQLVVYGHAIGMVDIVGCRPMTKDDESKALVKYAPGLWAWELENAVEIEPFPVCGQLGFFKLPMRNIRVKSTLC